MSSKKEKFAFLVHPDSLTRVYALSRQFLFLLRRVHPLTVKATLKLMPPFTLFHLKAIKSLRGQEIEGILILCPLLPEHFTVLDKQSVLKRILKGAEIARKYGAKILGLGGFTSIFSNQGVDIADQVSFPITTGNTFTASMVINSIYKAVNVLDYELKNLTLSIIGATGDIGRICAKEFVRRVDSMILVGRDDKGLIDLSNYLHDTFKIEKRNIKILKDPDQAAKMSNIVITATSSLTTLIKSSSFKKGSIICDVSLPPNISRNIAYERNDVLAYEGGYAALPFFDKIKNTGFKQQFIHGSIFGCLAETIVLTFERKFEPYSIGRGHITEERIKIINELGQKHGVTLAPFFCSSKLYKEEDYLLIRS